MLVLSIKRFMEGILYFRKKCEHCKTLKWGKRNEDNVKYYFFQQLKS